jgi:hypothetical protein
VLNAQGFIVFVAVTAGQLSQSVNTIALTVYVAHWSHTSTVLPKPMSYQSSPVCFICHVIEIILQSIVDTPSEKVTHVSLGVAIINTTLLHSAVGVDSIQ